MRTLFGLHKTRLYNKVSNETGASAVELAIILPVLVIILFGIFEFGLTYRDYLAITHAAREGARLAAVGKYSEDEVRQRANPVSPDSVTLSYITADGMPHHGEPAEVAVAYERPLYIPMVGITSIPLVSSARMRVEY